MRCNCDQHQSKLEAFDFLGFTHCCGTDSQGRFQVARLTVKKRMRATLEAIRAELMRRRHESVAIVGKWLTPQSKTRQNKCSDGLCAMGHFSVPGGNLQTVLRRFVWVGMQGIDLPITVAESDYQRDLHARVDVQVILPAPQVKGIHMSRLYLLLDSLDQCEALSLGWALSFSVISISGRHALG